MMPLVLLPGRRPMFPAATDLKPRPQDGLVALGGDLSPETLREAYRKGLFPWDGRQPIPWYSPDPRLVLDPPDFKASRSLRQRLRRGEHQITFDTVFRDVMVACATVPRPGQLGSWITPAMVDGYGGLHDDGIAHSVEVWHEGRLVGGLYGLAMGRAFFGESQFHLMSDTSKLATWALCHHLGAAGYHFVDCQQDTPHMRSLGAHLETRRRYLERLERALAEPDGWDEAMAAPPLA